MTVEQEKITSDPRTRVERETEEQGIDPSEVEGYDPHNGWEDDAGTQNETLDGMD